MKIKIKNLRPFEMLAAIEKISVEQAFQQAYATMLTIGCLNETDKQKLIDIENQKDQPIEEVAIELNPKQLALLGKLMMNRSMGEINDKVFDMKLSFLMLPQETQDLINSILSK